MKNKKKKIVVTVSGGFAPIHAGHIRLFKKAKSFGDELVVILNNDNWLKEKKGYVFIPQKERKEILESLRWVDGVVVTGHGSRSKDMTICAELQKIKPAIFANGGDRTKKDANDSLSSLNPEQALCQKLGIKMVFNVGKGGKIQSSSWLVKNLVNRKNIHQKS